MDSDDDDAPLTFRRGASAVVQEKAKPASAGGEARSGAQPQRPKAENHSANGRAGEDVPLAHRAAAQNGPGTKEGGAAKRPAANSAQGPGNAPAAKKAKPEPNPSPQKPVAPGVKPASGAPHKPPVKAGPNAPSVKPEPRNSPARAPPPPKPKASNGEQFVQRQARTAVAYKEESEEEQDEAEDEDEDEESSEEEEHDKESDEDDVPLSARAASSAPTLAGKKKAAAKGEAASGKKKGTGGGRGGGGGSGGRGGGQGKEDSSVKWTTLSHNGVVFPPPYTPHGIKILYNGKPVALTSEQEEVATMFAVMRETEYISKPKFLSNFWEDWKKILGSKHVIQKLELCDFTPIWEWHCEEKDKKKQMTSEEKKRIKEAKAQAEDKYMWAVIDGKKEKVGNFRVEPPGLFRGRGEHPKMGKLKKRIWPEDITINLGKEAPVPECPVPGHRWKEVRHDNTVTWLAYWADPINPREFKYVFLAPSSTLKGLSDKEKYEKARKLKDHIEKIRAAYTKNFKSGDEATRQIAVATYLIDRLALRAGNEKDDDEADTVGCCSLKVEHCQQVPPSSLQFDFLGKDSIRYFNTVEVLPEVYRAIGDFSKKKKKDEDLFDRLDTSKLNAHLKELMPGLTAKVFRTYNASITLDTLLQDTVGNDVKEKVADYQRANKEVAILCNHQRSVSKAHAAQMEKLQGKLQEVQTSIEEMEEDLERVKKGKLPLEREGKDPPSKKVSPESLEKKIAQAKARVEKMMLDMTIKDELKTVALGTSKINYMDPRITIAWCKLHEVPIERIFNKSLLAKFAWAMDVEPDFRF